MEWLTLWPPLPRRWPMRAGWRKWPGPGVTAGLKREDREGGERGIKGEQRGRGDGRREGQRNSRKELQQRATVFTSELPRELVSYNNSHGWGPGTSIHPSLESTFEEPLMIGSCLQTWPEPPEVTRQSWEPGELAPACSLWWCCIYSCPRD